jgi:hypothetical protein
MKYSIYICQTKHKGNMKTINTTEWYLILSAEYAKYEWIMKAMNETQVCELVANIKSDLRKQYKILN